MTRWTTGGNQAHHGHRAQGDEIFVSQHVRPDENKEKKNSLYFVNLNYDGYNECKVKEKGSSVIEKHLVSFKSKWVYCTINKIKLIPSVLFHNRKFKSDC